MAQKFVKIDGKMHDPEIINLAKGVTEVSITLAEQIWAAAIDGAKVTAAEINSVSHVMAKNKMEPAAKAFLARKLAATEKKCPGHLAPLKHIVTESQYKTIMGVKYEKELFNIAVEATQGGKAINLKNAKMLCEAAMDDAKITETEFRTIEYIMAFYPFEQDAYDFAENQLATHPEIESRTFKNISWIVSATATPKSPPKRTADEAGLTCWNHIYHLCPCPGDKCALTHESGFEREETQRDKSRAAARTVADSLKRLRSSAR